MAVCLIRHFDYSQSALLDPETGATQVVRRHLGIDESGKRTWFPPLAEDGWFDRLGGLFLGLYRDPPDTGLLWLQAGRDRFELRHGVSSSLTPQPRRRGAYLHGLRIRTFRLFEDHQLLFQHRYMPNRTLSRLAELVDFTAWPTDETDYDLLCFVDSILTWRDRRDRILRGRKADRVR